ncbi:MAG: GreA/GreB family elongation factor [Victivallaceae bacterium]|nr:GreA/GreB family elongation factor [Victivallaceae bacterium]
MSKNYDALFDAALNRAGEEDLHKLHKALAELETPAEHSELLGMLFESWSEQAAEAEDDGEDAGSGFSRHQAEFTICTLELKCGDNALFRKALSRAVRKLLPPYLNKPGLLRTIGINDHNVSIHEAVRRFRNLSGINANMLVFLRTSKRWGIIRNIDALAGTVAFVPVGLGSAGSLPVATLLGDGVMFAMAPDSQRLAAASRRVSTAGAEYRNIAKARALSQITEDDIRAIAYATLVPSLMNDDDFEAWWSQNGGDAFCAESGKRDSAHARSLKEMALLLEAELKEEKDGKSACPAGQIEGYRQFFAKLRGAAIAQEAKELAAVVGLLSEKLDTEELGQVLAPLAEKCPFLPKEPNDTQLEPLAVYGTLNVKILERMFKAFKTFLSQEYLAKLAMRLPLKALSVLADQLDDGILFETIRNTPVNADIFMYIWRNRAKRTAKLADMVNIASVVKVLNLSRLPKEWMVSVRELKNTLMDKADFQEFLLDSAEHDVKRITGALQGALSLTSGERQSLLVKFSRHSRELQQHLEAGAGQKLMKEATSGGAPAAKPSEPLYSSVASIRRLKDEYDNIVNVEQPKNREALKTARAHGDFRENSEFDAAKERRNFLTRRRNELERIMNQVQAVDLTSVKIEDHAVLGSTIVLEYPNGNAETYHLLGAWDGNPDKHYLSYKTRLGEAIYHHQTGTTLDLPGGKRAVLARIEPLSAEIIAELNQ